MTPQTKHILAFCEPGTPGKENFGAYHEALNQYAERCALPWRFQFGGTVFESRYNVSPTTAEPPDWQSLVIQFEKAADANDEGEGSITTDATGALCIVNMRIAGFAAPGTGQFARHLRTIIHELMHAYSPLEGYHLWTYLSDAGAPAGMEWDLRNPVATWTTGSPFERDPALQHCPSVNITEDSFGSATCSAFMRALIKFNVRNPWGWTRRGWLGTESNMVLCTADDPGLRRTASLGFTRELRRWPIRHDGGSCVLDITEFILAELLTGKREIAVTREMLGLGAEGGVQPVEEVKPPVEQDQLSQLLQRVGALERKAHEQDEAIAAAIYNHGSRIATLERSRTDLQRTLQSKLSAAGAAAGDAFAKECAK